jgi:hypothetical protein
VVNDRRPSDNASRPRLMHNNDITPLL